MHAKYCMKGSCFNMIQIDWLQACHSIQIKKQKEKEKTAEYAATCTWEHHVIN